MQRPTKWAHIAVENGVKVATVGILASAVQQLNDLVYMDLPEAGKKTSRW